VNRLSLIGGVAIGASVVYFFDRNEGRRRRSRLAHEVRGLADTLTGSVTSRRLARETQAKSRSWEVPMATVNIDIDQGTVTLRGAFPPGDVPHSGGRPHRGIIRSRGHAEARPGFDPSVEG
jgi:hypothetical protein